MPESNSLVFPFPPPPPPEVLELPDFPSAPFLAGNLITKVLAGTTVPFPGVPTPEKGNPVVVVGPGAKTEGKLVRDCE